MKLSSKIPTSPLLWICILVLWINRFLSFFAFPRMVTSPDSYDFFTGKGFDLSSVSIFGHALRPWPSALLYSSIGLTLSALVQLIFSGIASTVLVLELQSFLKNRSVRSVVLVGLVTILGSADFVSWDLLANIQSITNSSIVMFFAFTLKYSRKPGGRYFSMLMCMGILSSIQRPILILIILPTLFYLLARARKVRIYSMYAIVCLIFLGFVVIPAYNQNKYWPGTYSGVAVLGHLKATSPITQEFRSFLKTESVPECILESDTRSVWPDGGYYCKSGQNWAREKSVQSLLTFLLNNPSSALRLASFSFFGVATNSSTHYASAVSILPPFLDSLPIGTRDPKTTTVGELDASSKYYLYTPLFLLAIIYLALRLAYKKRRLNLFYEYKIDLHLIDLLVATNLISLMCGSIFIYAEWTRILEPNSLIFILSLIVGCGLILDSNGKRDLAESGKIFEIKGE
jgi:hypothetical protein